MQDTFEKLAFPSFILCDGLLEGRVKVSYLLYQNVGQCLAYRGHSVNIKFLAIRETQSWDIRFYSNSKFVCFCQSILYTSLHSNNVYCLINEIVEKK